jgi:hypothetical protein
LYIHVYTCKNASSHVPTSPFDRYFFTCASNAPKVEEKLLQGYLQVLATLLMAQGDTPPTLEALAESLALAKCDLGRWMSGWGWWGHDLQGHIVEVLDRLDGGKALASEEDYVAAMEKIFPV